MRRIPSMLFTLVGLVLLAVTALSACTVVVEDDSPGPVRPGPICSRQYDPVCARRGPDRQTFANACVANAEGYRVVHRGQCSRGDGGGGGPAFCTQQYDPVCARRGSERRTFPNSCVAESAGYRIIRGGECRPEGGRDRFCTREYVPVCARRGGQVRTFPNSCEADVAGFRIVADGPC